MELLVFLIVRTAGSDGEGGDGLFGSGCTQQMRTFGDLDSRKFRYGRFC
jgi:hypothetical protein